jgi:hypothetical protein
MKVGILNRSTGTVQFAAAIDSAEGSAESIKIGLTMRWRIKADAILAAAALRGADLARANSAGPISTAPISPALTLRTPIWLDLPHYPRTANGRRMLEISTTPSTNRPVKKSYFLHKSPSRTPTQ